MTETLQPTRVDTKFYASILQQTKWPCAFFDFRKANVPGISYFNCGLVRRPDGLWLVTRRSKNDKQVRVGFNDVVAWHIDENTMLPEFGRKLTPPQQFEKEHFEDPRAIFHQGKTFVSCCNFVVLNNGHSWTGAHQVMLEVGNMSTKEWAVTKRIDPVYGNNGNRIGADSGAEKNWLWFFHNNQPHMLYNSEPMTVVRFSSNFEFETEYQSHAKLQWEYGIVRGGTPPVRIGNEYWTFFHSSLKLDNRYHRRYYMGAYAFEAQPPFRITKITPEPLLAGSHQDMWAERKPLVVFPCGSEYQNGQWLVTMGINDLCSAWIRIPHEDIVARCDSTEEKSGTIKTMVEATKKFFNIAVDAATQRQTYYHSGNLGDVVYGLMAIKHAGGGNLFIGPEQNATSPCQNPITKSQFDAFLPLLKEQPYLGRIEYREKYPVEEITFDLNEFRNHWDNWNYRQEKKIHQLYKMHCHVLGVEDKIDEREPWIIVPNPIVSDLIIVHRSHRYHAKDFPWKQVIKTFGDRLAFVGLEEEHTAFQKEFGKIAFIKVNDLLHMAQIISGAKGFIGNQSFPCSVALACGQNVLQELWEPSPDCTFNRPGFATQLGGGVDYFKKLIQC